MRAPEILASIKSLGEGTKSDHVLGYLRSGGSERLAGFVARYPGLRAPEDVGPTG